MPGAVVSVGLAVAGVAAIVWGAEHFAENLARASARLGVSTFALALLLAGAEPEELATSVAATLRRAPAIAFGDVVGANVTICLVALGVGALVAPLPFGRRVFRYGLLGLPVGATAVAFAWDGRVGRLEGLVLVIAYVAYIAAIWHAERQPPALGETGELEEAAQARAGGRRVGRELGVVLAGLAAMVIGATLLVDGVRNLVHAEADQTRLSLTIVGFATGFELVVLAWSSARRGISEAVVAGVVGSYAYNATMTLGAAALVKPLRISDAAPLRLPMLAMLIALTAVLTMAFRDRLLHRRHGWMLLAAYLLFIAIALFGSPG
ncbi:MAG: sodium:calcium antiporter [Actinobacteria bacterium]|nr:sodium:calcium antiporter [Actinomycetota bacterium]